MNNLIMYTKIRNTKKAYPFSYLFIVEMQNMWNNSLFLQKPTEENYLFHFPFKQLCVRYYRHACSIVLDKTIVAHK